MIRIEAMKPHHLDEVIQLSVSDEQLPFVGTIDEILVNIDSVVHPHVILSDDHVVGFFLVDTTYANNYEFAESGSLGLRGYLIDQQYQGQGFGKSAVQQLSGFLAQAYPQFRQMYLTVNCKNPGAKHCYLSGGFEDTGSLYHGGAAGPQHIMKLMFAP
ncbi:GNAT family N-acetyltransferase [Photobacterium atrarenae]|uniref:GNAT family N-acetyltransferase n=1 Tax=Photobacterium atrarenae TaxID=865757 RepID=A0ABY5GK74_9GAMM|nr:GNAT family N-acetyltransferase [Photobacterium atrarenae]UTV29171.1 GNAT family N-acetyltransferase [Photobacterium atrarenae]